MGTNPETDVKKEAVVKRMAIITSICIFADCPIECVCVSTTCHDKRVTCGHYRGSSTNVNGSAINCCYQGK